MSNLWGALQYLQKIDENFLEKAFGIVASTMIKIILIGEKSEKSDLFSIKEYFPIYEIDFINLQPKPEGYFI